MVLKVRLKTRTADHQGKTEPGFARLQDEEQLSVILIVRLKTRTADHREKTEPGSARLQDKERPFS